MKQKAVVLLSGGIDSTTLMYDMIKDLEVWPLTISYGQRHNREVMAARNVCEARGGDLIHRWKYLDLSCLGRLLPSSLTGIGEIPDGHYADENMKSTVVPNRNMILLAIAAGYAQGIGAKYVAYAPHAGDHPIYPDCRPEFIKAAGEAIQLGTGFTPVEGVELVAPYGRFTKTDVVKLGKKLNVPYHLTWSCYKGDDIHCGTCGTCTERKEAFQQAGVQDPTQYVQ